MSGNYQFIQKLKAYGEKNKEPRYYLDGLLSNYNDRKNGKQFTFNEHLEHIIFSLLSNQREWTPISENRENIKKIFYNFDSEKIYKESPQHFIDELKARSLGNRAINQQMHGLRDNINVLRQIEADHGSIDKYYNEQSMNPYDLALSLAKSKSKYKLKNMGLALVCEYLKGVGIDIAKPDVHITRMLGKSHLGFSNDDEVSEKEAIELMKELAKRNNITQTEVDRLMWWYCADGYWQICTKLSPKCSICVIRDDCNKGRSIKPLRHE